jgi:uncharacterized protein (TIGR03083 family)
MTPEVILEAFDEESRRLSAVVARAGDGVFARPTPCAPWTVAELVFHVQAGMGRLTGMLTSPEPDGTPLVPAAGYYRADQRFSAATNADRVSSAQHGAAALADAAARARAFEETRQRAFDLVRDAPLGRTVRTRHGDRMLLTEFLRTRVLELAVHGLDLAAAMGCPPWMTGPAALVTEELLLAPEAAARLRGQAGWDRVALIATLTGRRPASAAEAQLIQRIGVQRLTLG